MDRQRINDLWYRRQTILGVAFGLEDAVTVNDGAHEGRVGVAISLEGLEPEPLYLVEFGDNGSSAILPESVLSAAA